jgi:hypothetical protein
MEEGNEKEEILGVLRTCRVPKGEPRWNNYPEGGWDVWHTIGEQGAINSAKAAAVNTLTHKPGSPNLEWRDLSDLPDAQWDAG